uniref:CCHC-type domain-containing protein n=1 Tax=Glossina austeni TaxID=7395 RepID=A0A1A9VGX7_GLOAU
MSKFDMINSDFPKRLDDKVHQAFQKEGGKFRDYAIRLEDMMRHLSYTTRQQLERICRNSRREYQVFFGNTVRQDLNETISLGERFEDIPAPTVASPPRETSGPSRIPRVNAPTTTNTSRNVCLPCAQPGQFANNCNNERVPFRWDCGRPGVLTNNCYRHNTREHTQARGMTVKEAIEQRERLSARAGAIITVGNTTVNITKHKEAQRPMSIQATNDNAEAADIENTAIRNGNIDGRHKTPLTAIKIMNKGGDLKSRRITKTTKANRTETTEPKSKTGIMATIPTIGSEHVSTNAKKETEDRVTDAPIGAKGTSVTRIKISARPAYVRNPTTMSLTIGNIIAKAATTRPDILRSKYSTLGKVIYATVRLARVFEELQNITMRGDTTIAMKPSRKTSKNKKKIRSIKIAKAKQAKIMAITPKIMSTAKDSVCVIARNNGNLTS